LLHGVGEKAHEWLVSGAPYKTAEDLAAYEYKRRVEAGVEKVDAKGKTKLKLGHSPLNRGVISTLIISGAMDSLFVADSDVLTKLQTYEEAYTRINGKKSPRAIPPRLLSVNQLMRYQMRKQILPAFAEPITPMLVDRKFTGVYVEEQNGKTYFKHEGDIYRFVSHADFERLSNLTVLPCSITIAVAAYVIKERRFKYQGSKTAVDLLLDHEGGRIKAVKWPDRKTGRLPHDFPENLEGSIAIVLLSKWNEAKPFTIEDVVVVAEPLSDEDPEESK
jgi:DNA polymerase III alpha subunit